METKRSWLSPFYWASLRGNVRRVLSINQRNLQYIYPHNRRRDYPLADDKLKTKELLAPHGIPMPRTYHVYGYFYELENLSRDLGALDDFVIKPAQGRAGNGIVVVAGREGEQWVSVTGRRHSLAELKKALSDIIFGIYSFDLKDSAIVEERLIQHPEMSRISPNGLADIRLILFNGEPVMAMTRLATLQSGGRANIHQGALGVGIDLKTGRTVHAVLGGRPVQVHPDNQAPVVGMQIPQWKEVLDIAVHSARLLPLQYLGVDIAVTPEGPVLVEVNVRPGLEIQNANFQGLAGLLAEKAAEGEAEKSRQ